MLPYSEIDRLGAGMYKGRPKDSSRTARITIRERAGQHRPGRSNSNPVREVPMIYLAAPYKDEDPSLMAERLEEVTRVAQKMIQAGLRVFSPLTYTCQFHAPPPDGWYEFDLDFLRLCDRISPSWSYPD